MIDSCQYQRCRGLTDVRFEMRKIMSPMTVVSFRFGEISEGAPDSASPRYGEFSLGDPLFKGLDVKRRGTRQCGLCACHTQRDSAHRCAMYLPMRARPTT